MSDTADRVKEIFEQMMTSYVLTNGDTTGYGFGLSIGEHRGLTRVSHGGADVAHRSMLAYYPEIGAGITTQSNHARFDGSIAFRLAEAFFGDYMEPEESVADHEESVFDPSTYDAEAFDEFGGAIALQGDRLVAGAALADDFGSQSGAYWKITWPVVPS